MYNGLKLLQLYNTGTSLTEKIRNTTTVLCSAFWLVVAVSNRSRQNQVIRSRSRNKHKTSE